MLQNTHIKKKKKNTKLHDDQAGSKPDVRIQWGEESTSTEDKEEAEKWASQQNLLIWIRLKEKPGVQAPQEATV